MTPKQLAKFNALMARPDPIAAFVAKCEEVKANIRAAQAAIEAAERVMMAR